MPNKRRRAFTGDQSSTKALLDQWVRLCHELAMHPPYYMSGVQKIVQGFVWKLPGPDFLDRSTNIEDFGYSETGHKIKALRRHYYDHEKFIAAKKMVRNKWEQRTYGSAQFPLTGETKKWTKQDFCMSSCTVTHFPSGGLQICIFYRTTEVIKKFGADLVFLRGILGVLDRIKSIEQVTFMFSNVTIHPMFFTTLLAHHENPIGFLEEIKERDPRFHGGIEKWMKKYLFEGFDSWVQKFSQAKQTHAAMLRLMDEETQDELRKYFADD